MSILDTYPPGQSAFNPALAGCLYQFNAKYSYTAIMGFNIYDVHPSDEHLGFWCASKSGAEGCAELHRPIIHDGLAYYLPEGLTWTKERRVKERAIKTSVSTRRAKDERVYFIHALHFARVKIGYSNDPAKRLCRLSAQSASPLVLLATVSGGAPLESRLHSKFAHLRIHGEWFQLETQLEAYIQTLQKGQV